MKYIAKQQQPNKFSQLKALENENWQPSWGNFQNPEKTIVHQSLLQEQGYICCYCGQRINQETSHIEHFKPREKYPNLSLDYHNLLASCPGYDEQEMTENQLQSEHCGHYKKNWYDEKLIISPLSSNCETFFRYTNDGQMLPTEDPEKQLKAKTTVDKLGLNSNNLKQQRRRTIKPYRDYLLQLGTSLSEEELITQINHILDKIETSDSEGKYLQFCFVIKSILETLKTK